MKLFNTLIFISMVNKIYARNISQYFRQLTVFLGFNLVSKIFREGSGTPVQYSCLEIPWLQEPGRLQSMGLLRVGHD